MEMNNGVEEYVSLFQQVKEKVGDVSAACLIVEQIGKDKRTEQLQQSFNGSKPVRKATYKQRRLLNALGVDTPQDLSVVEASKLIEETKARGS